MDQELKQLDLAIAEARRSASAALDALATPKAALRDAAGAYIESVAARRLEAARRASVEVMAKLDDDEIAELRVWATEQIALARNEIERDIESCDFWIEETSGLSPTDVSDYGGALMPRPKDSHTGIPQALMLLIEEGLAPLRRGLAAVGLAGIPAAADARVEMALVRAWKTYREAAVECVARWADVDERYHASAERFQELRWELAGEVDVEELKARREAEDLAATAAVVDRGTAAIAAEAAAAEDAEPLPELDRPPCTDAFARPDSETLIPISG